MIETNNFWIGVRHIFSPTVVSKYELVEMINEIYKLNITINKKETDERCHRNLNSVFTCPIKKCLYEQIIDMKNFKLEL